MSLMQALMQRLLPLFGGLFASHVETGIVLEQAEQLNAIEEKARQFEREGKVELAEIVRRQAARFQSDDPGRTGLRILANLEQRADSATNTPMLTSEESDTEPTHRSSRSNGPQRKRRRTARQASSSSPQVPDSSRDGDKTCTDE